MLHLSNLTKYAKKRLYAFFAFFICIIALLCILISQGISLNTNVLDLLSKSGENKVIEQADNQFSKHLSNEIVFLISNPTQSLAEKSAAAFYKQLQKKPIFAQIQYKINPNERQALAKFYFPHRFSLLSDQQRKQLTNKNDDFKEKNPTSASAQSPLFLLTHFLKSFPDPSKNLSIINNQLMRNIDGKWYVLINAKTKGDNFSISNQDKVLKAINSAKKSVLTQFKNTNILMTGEVFFAHAGSDEGQKNILTIGVGSVLGITLLMLLTFRSLWPLILTLFSSAIGFVTAFVITQLLFGTVYLFTLIFGASLIGISVDYAFFYYAEQLLGGKKWHPMDGLKNILPGITIGLLNIIFAYIILSFTAFPALKQLAVFASIGLAMAYATVVCVFPALLTPKKKQFTPPLLQLTNRYLHFFNTLSIKWIAVLFSLLTVISLTGLYFVHTDDSVKTLETSTTQLINEQKSISHVIGLGSGNDFFVVTGKTPEATLQNAERTLTALKKSMPTQINSFSAISFYVQSTEKQKANYALLKHKLHTNTLDSSLTKMGATPVQQRQISYTLSKQKFSPLTIEKWLASPVSIGLRHLWLGKIDKQYVTIIVLPQSFATDQAVKIANQFSYAHYINQAHSISETFKSYRQRISILLLIAYGLLFVLLMWRYCPKRAFFYFLPPFYASLLSLSIQAFLGIPITLFTVLALILVLGIGADYVIFFIETKGHFRSTMLAITLSALTTILSFGLLALSTTPIIHYFGVTVLIGILTAFLLSPLAMRAKNH